MVAGVTELRRGRPLRLLRTLEPGRQITEHRGDPAQARHAGATGCTGCVEAAPAAGMLLKKRVQHAVKLCTLQSEGAKGNADVGARAAPASA